MKIKRYKKVSRYLNFYINNFQFRQPYQLLIDGTFCLAALKNNYYSKDVELWNSDIYEIQNISGEENISKEENDVSEEKNDSRIDTIHKITYVDNQVNIADNIPKYLNGEVKLLTTSCAIIETEKLGPQLHGALLILKQYSLHKCGHAKQPISGAKCFLSMIENKNENHYIIATQDRDFQKKLRVMPGVPLLYLHSKAPVLERPCVASMELADSRAIERYGVRETEKSTLQEIKDYQDTIDANRKTKKRKGPKGPNPLSCKKKKKQNSEINKNTPENSNKKKAKRKVRIAKHVKEELSKTEIKA